MARTCHSTTPAIYLFTGVILAFAALLLTGCELSFRSPPPTAADYCNIAPSTISPGDQLLEVWAPDARQHCLRLYAPVIASAKLDGVTAVAVEKNINANPFHKLLISAAQSQQAPDIAFMYNGTVLQQLADSGYLYSLANCNLSDPLSPAMPQREWSYPFELEVLMLFYSKRILRDLGWSETQIDRFPTDLGSGTINLDDLLTIALEALSAGAVKPGFAFTVHDQRFYTAMHIFRSFGGKLSDEPQRSALFNTYRFYERLRNDNLMHPALSQPQIASVTNRFSLRDALANGRILFAHTVTSEWTRMLLDHTTSSSDLQDNIGIALFPSINEGGSAMMSTLGSYVVFSEKATGKPYQQQACAVIRQIASSELHQQHATNTTQVAPSMNAPWLPSVLPPVAHDRLHHVNQLQQPFDRLHAHINQMTESIAEATITAEQAAALSHRTMRTQ